MPTAKKPAPKKAAAPKQAAAAKKAAPKKPAAPNQAAAKKAAPNKTAPKNATPKKPAPKQAAPKKSAPKKPAPKQAAPKKAAPKQAAPKKAAPKKAAQPTSVAKKTPVALVESVFLETGWSFKKEVQAGAEPGGEIVHWDVVVPPEEHFDVAAQLFGGEQLVLSLSFREPWAEDRRGEMLELFARVNHGLLLGAYETDLERRSVRLRSSLDFRGVELNPRLVVNLILGVMDVSEIYDDAILSVMRGEASAKDAIAEIESAD